MTDISGTEKECGGGCFSPDMILCCLYVYYKTRNGGL